MIRRFDGHDPSAGHDSGRVPWAGRNLTASPFGADDGRADPDVRRSLIRVSRATGVQRVEAEIELLRVLGAARLLVPIVAEPIEVVETHRPDGSPAAPVAPDAQSDMASLVLTAPDGARAMPVFSGVDTLAVWNRSARPVPVASSAAGQAAIEQGCVAVPVDLGSGHVVALRLSHVWALAQARQWQPPGRDPVVAAVLSEVAAGDDRIDRIAVHDVAGGRAQVVLSLAAGLSPGEVRARTDAVAAALADPDVRIRLDDVTVAVRAVPSVDSPPSTSE